jgi:hypothetical protein
LEAVVHAERRTQSERSLVASSHALAMVGTAKARATLGGRRHSTPTATS